MKIHSPRPFFTRAVLGLAALGLAVLPARATWSIVCVDTSTGEVCVAGATCLNIGLQTYLPVIVAGKGAAAAQSAIDSDGSSLMTIHDGFEAGDSPGLILIALEAQDAAHQSRQYGIVDFEHAPVSFTGTQAGAGKLSVTGQFGTIKYAIQGNVLTGPEVVLAAEQAFRRTVGDLGQRAMAGMEAARQLGGDGRCSCSLSAPTSCGVPPPSFTKTAESSFLLISRIGDFDGACNPPGGGPQLGGCAKGSKYVRLTDKGPIGDSVLRLEGLYDAWRVNMQGVPDHLHTEVLPDALGLPADGSSEMSVRLVLRDLDGARITNGGFGVTVRPLDPAPPTVRVVAPVVDHGDGTYTFTMRASTHVGRARHVIRIDDGVKPVQLYPPLVVTTVDPAGAR